MKRIAALTMLRNDEFFLGRWVSYYGGQLGRENLFIFFDGEEQEVPAFCEGTNYRKVPHIEGNVAQADRGRINYLSKRAAELFESGYDMVIGTDVDEFLMVDPASGETLAGFLDRVSSDGRTSISGLGVDVGQNTLMEKILDEDEPFLGQRRFAVLSTRYSKSSVITRPVAWGSGFHRTREHGYKIVPGLFLFHFGCADLARMQEKFLDRERINSGWNRHFRKRIRTIRTISSRRAGEWTACTGRARVIQNILHPLSAWNKPAMLGMKVVVRIPDRFTGLV